MGGESCTVLRLRLMRKLAMSLNNEGDFATVDEVVTEAKDNETIIQKAI